MNHETLYLKEAFGSSIEFPNEAKVFQLDAFPDFTAFIVLSKELRVVQANFASTSDASTIASTPNTSTVTTRPSRTLSRCALACLKNRLSWHERQHDTKGKFFLSHFLLTSTGWGGGKRRWLWWGGGWWGENGSSKVNVTEFWTFFFQKTFFTPGSPSCYSFWSKIHLCQTLRTVLTICWCSLSGAFEKNF